MNAPVDPHHAPATVAASAVRRVGLTSQPLSVQTVVDSVAHPGAGGQAFFLGTVRDHDAGRGVVGLSYSAHPTAAAALRGVVDRVAAVPGVLAVSAEHRLGELSVGDAAVVVAVSCAHRGEAFDLCRRLIDELKAEVPIWKHQRFLDGTEEWVGTP